MCANQRKKINSINSISDGERHSATTIEEINHLFQNYFQGLVATLGPKGIDECLQSMDSIVTDEMNTTLLQEFTTIEVE